jgi:arylsulfatase A-like enzyme
VRAPGKRWIGLSLAALLAAVLAIALLPRPDERRRNLLLISIDTLRADHLGCYGYPRNTTPTLDRLAAEGVLFENATAPSSWTVPSHASLLSGRYPRSHGVQEPEHRFPDDVETLASLLEHHGYASRGIINVGLIWRLSSGFRSYRSLPHATGPRGMASVVHATALRWLERRPERPVFLFLHHYDVHSDYVAQPRYERMFAEPYAGVADGTTEQLKRVRGGGLALDAADAQHLANLYDAGIRQLDDALGDFLAVLRERELLEDMLLVITSDHGEEFLEHGDVLHGRTLHQELVRVPLIFWGDGLPRGLRVSQPVSLVDVMPTLTAQLGIPSPSGIEGISLDAYWREGSEAPDRGPIFSETSTWMGNTEEDFRHAVRSGAHTLHRDGRSGAYALYDLRADPLEQVDIAPREPERVAELRRELDRFAQAERVPAPLAPLSDEETEELRRLGYVQ